MEDIFVCPDGGRLRYCTAGSGNPVVLIHGLSLDTSMWDPQWPELTREFRAIRYDLRGFGGSSVPQAPYSHSEDLLGLLDFLGARPAHLVGLSMGGRVALRFALDQPQAVKSLTLIDSALEGHSWTEEWSQTMHALVEAAGNGGAAAAKQLWLAHELFAPARRDAQVAAALAAMVGRYTAWHWANVDPIRKPPSPASEALSTLRCPTLVLVGELDLPDFTAIAQRLAATIPQATLHTIRGAGHMANMEAPAAVNELLLGHLRHNSAAP
jgi:pimeloyl-ACP methyl ester carboxylesterase